MVGDRRIELLTSSVSRKRSTSELIAQRDEILLANVRPVNSLSGFGALPSQRLIEKLTSTYGSSRWKLVFQQIPPEFSFTYNGLEYPGLPSPASERRTTCLNR